MLITISVGSRMANIQSRSRACFECSFLLCSKNNLSSCLHIISSGWMARVVNVYNVHPSSSQERITDELIDSKPHSNPIEQRLMSCLFIVYQVINLFRSVSLSDYDNQRKIVKSVHVCMYISISSIWWNGVKWIEIIGVESVSELDERFCLMLSALKVSFWFRLE